MEYATHTRHFVSFTVETHTHIHKLSLPLWGPLLWTPLTLFKVPWSLGDSSLPLESVSDPVIWDWQWQWQSQRPPLPGRTKQNIEKDRIPSLRTARTAVVVYFKGVFVQKCSFYDCYYNYCYDYLIKDLYHTEESVVPLFYYCDALKKKCIHTFWLAVRHKAKLLIAKTMHTNANLCSCFSVTYTSIHNAFLCCQPATLGL